MALVPSLKLLNLTLLDARTFWGGLHSFQFSQKLNKGNFPWSWSVLWTYTQIISMDSHFSNRTLYLKFLNTPKGKIFQTLNILQKHLAFLFSSVAHWIKSMIILKKLHKKGIFFRRNILLFSLLRFPIMFSFCAKHLCITRISELILKTCLTKMRIFGLTQKSYRKNLSNLWMRWNRAVEDWCTKKSIW